jgi:hypothetical protein
VNKKIILPLIAASFVLGGCTTYAQPDTALRGVSYTGGEWESKAFLRCVEPGANEAVDTGGETYYYPITTRTFDFSTRPGADAPPINVSTSNNQELSVGGTITFTLDTSCEPYKDKTGKEWPGGKLQMFHDTIGRSKGAFFGEESTVVPPGWKDAMNIYLGGPAERTMDNVGGAYTWQELYSDKTSTDEFTKQVKAQIPDQIAKLTGGEQFYLITDIQIDKPNVSGELRTQMERAEAGKLSRDNAAAEQGFIATFPGGPSAYQAWKEQQSRANLQEAMARCFNENRCTAIPVGSN